MGNKFFQRAFPPAKPNRDSSSDSDSTAQRLTNLETDVTGMKALLEQIARNTAPRPAARAPAEGILADAI